MCRKCIKKYRSKYYKKNKDHIKVKSKRNNTLYKQRNAQFIWDYLKEHPCTDCGETDPVVLEFDHRGDKKYHLSEMVSRYSSLTKINQEIAKCDVRCANCHRRKTAKQFNFYRTLIK